VAVATVERAEASTALYLRLMSGREQPTVAGRAGTPAERIARQGDGATRPAGPTLMRCEGLSIAQNGSAFDLEVRSGELLGVAGLEGHGAARFVSCLAGVSRPTSGAVRALQGSQFKRITSYRQAFASGVVYVPGNRQTEGLFAPLSVIDNLAVAVLGRLSRFGFFSAARPRQLTQEYVARLGIEAPDISDPVSTLSGGNQQKVLVGRWLAARPSVLVMNDPLRGVDQGTKLDFYRVLRELADNGAAVVVLSTEIEELLTVCDRVAVFHNQTLWRMVDRQDLTYDEILQAMFGQPTPASRGVADQ
jgi:ribose transport system ATP-binding protein